MTEANRKVLDDCRVYYNQILMEQRLHGISSYQRKEIERVIAEEFQPGFAANFDCEDCIKGMITLAYYYYDKL